MKLKLKAYKVILNFGRSPIKEKDWNNKDLYSVTYGKNQKEALNGFCMNDENCTYWEIKKAAKARRFKDGDLYSQEPSELLSGLTEGEIHQLIHSLGVEVGNRFKGSFYRNGCMYYEKHEDCEKLVTLGLMEHWQKMGSEVYAVTEKGKQAIMTLLLITEKQQ